jgi:hypothetical protein
VVAGVQEPGEDDLRAATVWARLPPPSCSRMIEPVLVLRMMLETMAVTPGRDQSRGSTDQSSGVIPACLHCPRAVVQSELVSFTKQAAGS